MMRHLQYKLFFLALILSLSSTAQTLEIVEAFKMDEYSTVLTTYKNEFGHREKRGIDDSFPFAVLEVHLQGDARAVKAAKENLSLDLGTQYSIEGVTKAYDNKIVFLISSRVRNIYMLCGDGCEKQVIFDGTQPLKADKVYYGTVYYTPLEEKTENAVEKKPSRRFFTLQVEPKNAVIEVKSKDMSTIWTVREDGLASQVLNYGSYKYKVSAPHYHTEEGSFVVSDVSGEKVVKLVPKYGWLLVTGPRETKGANVFLTDPNGDIRRIGTLPLHPILLDKGEYELRVQQPKYKDFIKTITINDGDTTREYASVESNYTTVTLVANDSCDIYLDQAYLGHGKWTGNLEYGELVIESRQAHHRSGYTTIQVTPESEGETFFLDDPTPVYGSLIVQGEPYGATVQVDGVDVGVTPLILDQLLAGKHEVVLSKDDYASKHYTVEVEDDRETSLSYELEKGFMVGSLSVEGERVRDAQARIEGNDIIVSYDLPKKSRVRMYAASDSAFAELTDGVKGALGKGISKGTHEIVWSPLTNRSHFVVDSVKIKVKAISPYQNYSRNVKVKTLFMGQAGYGFAPQITYGGIIAQMYKGVGWYVNGRSNFNFHGTTDLTCTEGGFINGERAFYSGNKSVCHYIGNFGLIGNFLEKSAKNKFNTFGIYLGAGYGMREVFWETTDGKMVKYLPNSYQGVSANAGLFFSVCGLTFSGGISTIKFEYLEVEAGVGFMF